MKKTAYSRTLAFVISLAMILTSLFACGVSVIAADTDLVITDCDTTAGWVNTGGTAVDTNVNGYGTNTAIHRQVMYGATRLLTYNLPEALDISSYTSVEFDVMFYSQAETGRYDGQMWEQILEAYQSEIYLKLISEGGNDRIYRIGKLNPVISTTNTNWVHFTANIDNYNTDRSFDPSKLTGFYFSTVDGKVNTNVVGGFIRFDNIKATGYVEPKIEDYVISECEDKTNWEYSGNVSGFTVSSAGKTGSALLINGGYGLLRKLTYTPEEALDLSAYSAIEWDMTALAEKVITDQFELIARTYSDTIAVEISDGTNTVKRGLLNWSIAQVNTNWWHMAVSLENTNLDLTNIVSFAIYVKSEGAANDQTIANTLYKFDNLIATGNDVVANGYDYFALDKLIINDCSTKSGWSLNGNEASVSISEGVAGYTGNAVQAFGAGGGVFPFKYTFTTPVNLSRHSALNWKMRFLKAGSAVDAYSDVLNAFADTFTVTVADSKSAIATYTLTDIIIEETDKGGWRDFTINLANTDIDLKNIASITFTVSPKGTALLDYNVNMRVDEIAVLPEFPVVVAKGDVNGDTYINIVDLICLKKYLANVSVNNIVESACDVNGDSEIGADDITALINLLINKDEVSDEVLETLSNNNWSTSVKPL